MKDKIICPKCGKRVIKGSACCWYCGSFDILKNGEPCNHPGCLNHITHPCEMCGRVQGLKPDPKEAPRMVIF